MEAFVVTPSKGLRAATACLRAPLRTSPRASHSRSLHAATFAASGALWCGTLMRSAARRRSRQGQVRSSVLLKAEGEAWEGVPIEDFHLDGSPKKGFTQVCLADPKKLLGPQWSDLESFLQAAPQDALTVSAKRGSGPPLLVRKVEPGTQSWPLLQEGRS